MLYTLVSQHILSNLKSERSLIEDLSLQSGTSVMGVRPGIWVPDSSALETPNIRFLRKLAYNPVLFSIGQCLVTLGLDHRLGHLKSRDDRGDIDFITQVYSTSYIFEL